MKHYYTIVGATQVAHRGLTRSYYSIGQYMTEEEIIGFARVEHRLSQTATFETAVEKLNEDGRIYEIFLDDDELHGACGFMDRADALHLGEDARYVVAATQITRVKRNKTLVLAELERKWME